MTINKAPYLISSRDFPEDSPQALSVQINKAYLDIALKVNDRTIAIFPVGGSAINGEAWFIRGGAQKQQGSRQVYTFTGSSLTIPHGLNLSEIPSFVRIFGTFTDGTNWYPLPYVDTVSATNQVNVYVDPTNINITAGGGSPPTIVSGLCVLEWLSNP